MNEIPIHHDIDEMNIKFVNNIFELEFLLLSHS